MCEHIFSNGTIVCPQISEIHVFGHNFISRRDIDMILVSKPMFRVPEMELIHYKNIFKIFPGHHHYIQNDLTFPP